MSRNSFVFNLKKYDIKKEIMDMFREKYLTVKDLKIILGKYPENLPIAGDCGLMEAEDIKFIEDYCNGDYANPKCEYLAVLKIE